MKILKNEIIYYIISIGILICPFNITILDACHKSFETIIKLTLFASFFLLILLKIKRRQSKIMKIELKYICVYIIVLILYFLRNKELEMNAIKISLLYFPLYLLLPILIDDNEKIIRIFFNCISFFLVEHLIGVTWEFLFKNQYYNIFIIRFMGNVASDHLLSDYTSGYLTGFTNHYSTTGIYLSIGIIYYFSKLLKEKNNKKNIFLLAWSIISLLLCGKRAVLFISIFSCLICYLFENKEKVPKRVFNSIISIFIAMLLIFIVAPYIPQFTTTLKRFKELEGDETLGGRKVLYEGAIRYWQYNKALGNGWRSFRYYISRFMNKKIAYDVHNVFLQLLCETGVIGLVFFVSLFIYALIISLKHNENKYIMFSKIFQLYFVLYCFTGNPLYDIQCYSIYIFCIGILLNILIRKGENFSEKNRNSNIS